MSNREKLKTLLMDIFLLPSNEFRFDMTRDEVATWDSLGTVAMAVGVQEVFEYHFTPEEAMSVQSFQDIVRILESKGVPF